MMVLEFGKIGKIGIFVVVAVFFIVVAVFFIVVVVVAFFDVVVAFFDVVVAFFDVCVLLRDFLFLPLNKSSLPFDGTLAGELVSVGVSWSD
jgi:hypothetical protein